MPWAPIAYPAATEILKAALDNGANFWNGVCFFLSQPCYPSHPHLRVRIS